MYVDKIREITKDVKERLIEQHRTGDMKDIYDKINSTAEKGEGSVQLILSIENINMLSNDGFRVNTIGDPIRQFNLDSNVEVYNCRVIWFVE